MKQTKETTAFSDVSFLDLKSVEKVESLKDLPRYPIPVQIQSDVKSVEEIQIEAIAAGLIKVMAVDSSYLKNVPQFASFSDGECREAYDYYRTLLLQIHPNTETDLSLAGIAKTNAGDFPFAEQILLAVKNIGHSSKSYVNLAVLYANQTTALQKEKKTREAENCDEKIVKILHEGLQHHPDDPDILVELGGYHLRHHDLEIAGEFFEDSLPGIPEGERKEQIKGLMNDIKSELDHENAVLAAYDQIMMGNEEKALAIMEEYLKIESGSWEGWYVKGWALRCLERYTEANEALLKSVSMNPEVSAAYNELAICAKESGNLQLSKEYLSMAVEMEEDNVIYAANLAYLYLSEKNYDQARYYLEQARRIDSSDSQVIDLMEEYEVLTGEKLGDIIVEEIHDKEEVQELAHEAHEHGHHVEDI